MLELPFFREIRDAKSVLIAGAGGSYDVFCGLRLYFALRDAGKQVVLANLSFTPLQFTTGRKLTPALVEINADSQGPGYVNYFPEGYLCQWLRSQGDDAKIYCFHRTGAVPLLEGYRRILEERPIDAIVLVDGGTDSLMRGDEVGLGTPEEDIASIAAVDQLDVPVKLLVCLGFGIDHFHGVCHAHVLEAVADLIREGGYLGCFSLLREMPEVERYRQAAEAVFTVMDQHVSIVTSSIVSAIEGRYGDYHRTDRTRGSKLWINPLMSLYWCFRLRSVAARIQYLDAMKQTNSYSEVQAILFRHQHTVKNVREWMDIPL
jgi:hypothetical protein